MIETFLPGLVPSTTMNSRGHWAKRHRNATIERELAFLKLNSVSKYVALPAVVTLIRKSPRALDDDNAVGAMKSIRDGVADWFHVNDRDPRITWRVQQEKCKRAEAGTIIRVEAVR